LILPVPPLPFRGKRRKEGFASPTECGDDQFLHVLEVTENQLLVTPASLPTLRELTLLPDQLAREVTQGANVPLGIQTPAYLFDRSEIPCTRQFERAGQRP
jgi:hypothetical protein